MPNTAAGILQDLEHANVYLYIVRFNNITERDQTQRGYIISEEINRRNNNNIYTGVR